MLGSKGLGVALALLAGCADPSLDLAGRKPRAPRVIFDPASDPSAVSEAFRARISGVAEQGKPWLFRDELSDYYERALRRGELPATLLERAVRLRYWRDGDDWLLQPLSWLEQGATYAVALEGQGSLLTVHVSEQPRPHAARLFPPAERPVHQVALWCAPELGAPPETVELEPGAVAARLTSQAWPAELGSCVMLAAEGALEAELVGPPALGGVLLEPSAFTRRTNEGSPSVACVSGRELAGACLELLDDRVLVTPLAEDALWLLEEPREVALSARAGQRATLISGLGPGSELMLRGRVVAASGTTPLAERVVMSAARRHVVLSEVLANALGPEPNAEWLEIGNDSQLSVSLRGLWLEDSGGHAPLPDATLEPGELAVLVSAGFNPSGLDVPIPEGVKVLTLPTLGARGLSNSGEPLLLVGAEGVVSRFPLVPAPRAGRSVARRTLDAADDDAAGFGEHGKPGASPGAPNSFE